MSVWVFDPWWHVVAIFAAGLWAGTINTVVGSGTLVSFPVLVALGYPPVTATTSNAIGLAPGTISGTFGYRRELAGQGPRIARFTGLSAVGAVGGTLLLLQLPAAVFETVVPWLIGLAVLLVLAQPKVSAWLLHRGNPPPAHGGWVALPLVLLIGVYGGYFTAAQGVLLIAVLGILVQDSLQRLNALKNFLAAVVNVVAGAIYAVAGPVSWPVIAVLAVSSTLGGLLGALIGRKLPPLLLRVTIVVIGLAAIVNFLLM